MPDFSDFGPVASEPYVAPKPTANGATKPPPPFPPEVGEGIRRGIMDAGPLGLNMWDAADLGDMFFNIFPGAVAVGADAGIRAKALGEGDTHKSSGERGRAASATVMDTLGSPLHKLMVAAGMGESEGDSHVGSALNKVADWVSKGGEWIEKNLGGILTKEDVQSLADTGMLGLGARASAKMVQATTPPWMQAETAKFSAGQLRKLEQQQLRAKDAPDVAKHAEAQTEEALSVAARMPDVPSDAPPPFPDEPFTPSQLKSAVEGAKGGSPSQLRSALENAKAKVGNGQKLALTAEERVAYKGWKDSGGTNMPEKTVDEQGKPLGPTPSTDLLQRMAAAGVAAGVIAFTDDDTKQKALAGATIGLGLAEMKGLPADTPLGVATKRNGYTLSTLERLDPAKFDFSKKEVVQALGKASAGKAERAIIESVLAKAEGERISAKELVAGVKEATGDFTLKSVQTDTYADYGLDRIDREEAEYAGEAHTGNHHPTTTLWDSPVQLSSENHFNDPNLFGWTRSFNERGVPHVVEIQSDLVQHSKVMTSEERASTEIHLQEEQASLQSVAKLLDELSEGGSLRDSEAPTLREAIEKLPEGPRRAVLQRLELEQHKGTVYAIDKALNAAESDLMAMVGDLKAKLAGGAGLEKISPMAQGWYKRLIREEVGKEAKAIEKLESDIPYREQKIAEINTQIQSIKDARGENYVYDPAYRRLLTNRQRLESQLDAAKSRSTQRTMRFATADTVAKVEGWPRAPRDMLTNDGKQLQAGQLRDEGHQRIYDRYKGGVESFLKSEYAAKEVRDEHGHTWLEIKVPRPGPTKMFGGADIKTMARLAAIGVGAWAAGQYADSSKVEAAVAAGLGIAALSTVKVSTAGNWVKKWFGKDTRVNLDTILASADKVTRLSAIDTYAVSKRIEGLVPDVAARGRVWNAVETVNPRGLSPTETQAYNLIRQYKQRLENGLPQPLLESARDAYNRAIWMWTRNNKDAVGAWLDQMKAQKVHPSLAAGKAQGFVPLSEDPSHIMGTYTNAIARTIVNNWVKETLRQTHAPQGGANLVEPQGKAPASYVPLNHPTFRGLVVHPEIKPSLETLFDTSNPTLAGQVIMGLSDTAKRIDVSFSLFHAKALTDAFIGAGKVTAGKVARGAAGAAVGGAVGGPIGASIGGIAGYVGPELWSFARGTSKYLKELEKGSASPLLQRAIEGGLVISLEKMGVAVEDAGQGFYQGMKALQGALDKAMPGLGLPIEGLQALNKHIDTLMWARLHAGMKLSVFAEKYQAILDNAAKKGQQLSPEQAARIAAQFSNTTFGGLNWTRFAEQFNSRFARTLSQALTSPGARRVAQVLMFAPDWTVSTTMAAVRAFGRPDLLRPTTVQGLHQQYVLRSAAYYLLAYDTINHAMSGHHIWQNKDPTMVDMDPKGDRKMQASKHAMEPIHWVTRGRQQALNKLGIIPKEVLEQLFDKDYLSAKGTAPPINGRIAHVLKKFTPIAVQQGSEGGLAGALSGAAGVPIYGKTAEQKRKAAEERRRRKAKEHK